MLYISHSFIMVDEYGPEGAVGCPQQTTWSGFDRVMLKGIKELNEHLHNFQCVPLEAWEHNPTGDDEDQNRYDWCYVGDENGCPDKNGQFIYDVTIYVNECEMKPFILPKTVSA